MKIALPVAFLLTLSSAAVAAPDLVLALELERGSVLFESPVAFTVTFENRGDAPVTYFEPLFAESTYFPTIRLVNDADGRVYAPWVAPFQSMVSEGIQGALIKLGPGEKKVYRHSADRFVWQREEKKDWMENQALPSGSYRVTAEYHQPDDEVPYNTGGFDVEQRPVPGLFIGRLTTEPVRLLVADQTRPRMVIAIPDPDVAILKLTLTNPLDRAYELKGFPFLTVSSKMYGSGTAHPALTSPADGSFDQPVVITVPAGGTNTFTINLRALTFIRGDRRRSGMFGLGEFIPSGTVHVKLDVLDQDGGLVLGADGIYARIAAPKNRGLEDLKILAALSKDEIGAAESVTLRATLQNAGGKDLPVRGDFSFPQRILIRVEDATGKRPSSFSVTHSGGLSLQESFRPGESMSRLAKGLSFDGNRFDQTVGLKSGDVVLLAPGDQLTRDFPLAALLSGGFKPGEYRVSVGYRNFEPGLRLGLAGEDLLGVGVVWSEPVSLKVR